MAMPLTYGLQVLRDRISFLPAFVQLHIVLHYCRDKVLRRALEEQRAMAPVDLSDIGISVVRTSCSNHY